MKEALFSKDKRVYTLAAIALGIILLLIALNPAIKGYKAYAAVKNTNYSIEDYGKNVIELENKCENLDNDLVKCKESNENLFEDYLSQQNKTLDSASEYEACIRTFEQYKLKCDDDKQILKEESAKELDDLYEKLDEMKEQNDELEITIENTAINICCKAKIDNQEIDSYSIEDNKVVCGKDKEKTISCSFS